MKVHLHRAIITTVALLSILLVLTGFPNTSTAVTKMYWTSENKVQRANLDGSDLEDLVTGLLSGEGFAVDESEGQMYWTDESLGKIQKANLDGTDVAEVVTGLMWPQRIALDVDDGKMYWTHDSEIQRANLDGTEIESLVTGLMDPVGIALDTINSKMYWTDGNKINRANLDGTDIEELVTGSAYFEDITLDLVGGKVYLTSDDPPNVIWKANLDGSDLLPIVSIADTFEGADGIALDVDNGKIYFTLDDGRIMGANLDGSDVKTIITGLDSPADITLVYLPILFCDIKANGSNGPLIVSPSTHVNITVTLDPGNQKGKNADWWIGALTTGGTRWLNPSLKWVKSNSPVSVRQGPLIGFSGKAVLNTQLPIGIYTFFFVLDDTPDGIFDIRWRDFVNVICESDGT